MKKILLFLSFIISSYLSCAQSGDILVKSNGDTIRCKVVEINNNMVSYSIPGSTTPVTVTRNEVTAFKPLEMPWQRGANIKNMQRFGAANGTLMLSAGDILVKAQNMAITGIIIQAAGIGLALGMDAAASKAKEPGGMRDAVPYVVGIAFTAGIIFEISAWSQVGKAGRIMNEKKVGVALNQNGIGLQLHF